MTTASFPEGGGSGGYYTIDGIQTNSLQITTGQPHTIQAYSPDNTKWSFWQWSDGNTSNPRSITPSGSVSYNAVYKGIHISTDPSAFTRGSQRRLIQTICSGTKWLHQVYTSMGHVWIEHSSNGGSSWTVGNYGQPLDGTAGGKCPSIAYVYYAHWGNSYIGVVWEQLYGSTYAIKGELFNQFSGGTMEPTYASTLYVEPSDPYSTNANPNIVMNGDFYGWYLITIERKSTGSLQPGINWILNQMVDYTGGQDEAFPNGPGGLAGLCQWYRR